MLKSSVCHLYQDAAGRLGRFENVTDEDGTEQVEFALDSPLNNMALYREIMRKGNLTDLQDDIFPPCETPPEDCRPSEIDLAATFFGAAFDKSGSINMDTIIYTNQILDLPQTTVLPTVCTWIRGEEMGEIAAREKCFIDYSVLDYTHDRGNKFGASGSLPNPPYVPKDPETPLEGEFEFLKLYNGTEACPLPDQTYFQKVHGNIHETVFKGANHTHEAEDAAAMFAQAADDARAVINYMHSWPVPADFATTRVCTPYNSIIYNLYIASLQVPISIVVGAEDRELFVTVGNSGRDPAEGVLLTVKGTVEGKTKTLGYNGETALGVVNLEDLENIENVPFDLNPGQSKTFTGFVPGDLTASTVVNVGSVIEWEAAVSVPDEEEEEDYPMTDNVMTDITTVVGGNSKKPPSSHLRAL